jgi:uncharacterized protein
VMLGLAPVWRRRTAAAREPGLIASIVAPLVGRPSATSALALGVATGFLPCPIVFAFLASAMATGSVLLGMGLMAAMGVGTIWSLLALGLTGRMLTVRLRRWGRVVAAAAIILLGIATMMRGTLLFHQILGCPREAPEVAAPADPSTGAPPGAMVSASSAASPDASAAAAPAPPAEGDRP